jgi:hypothetical protein
MSSSEAAIIAGRSAFGGGLIVAVSNYAVSWRQAREARKAELQRAIIRLWAVVSRIDHQLRSEPVAGEMERKINEAMSSRLPGIDYNLGRLSRRLLQPHLDAFVVDMNNASPRRWTGLRTATGSGLRDGTPRVSSSSCSAANCSALGSRGLPRSRPEYQARPQCPSSARAPTSAGRVGLRVGSNPRGPAVP